MGTQFSPRELSRFGCGIFTYTLRGSSIFAGNDGRDVPIHR